MEDPGINPASGEDAAASGGEGPLHLGLHPDVTCDKTGNFIVGTRYHLEDQDYDLCEAEFQKLNSDEQAKYEAIAPPIFADSEAQLQDFLAFLAAESEEREEGVGFD